MSRPLSVLVKILAACLAVVTLGAAFTYVYTRERHDLPPFDRSKAGTLSPPKRAQYERDLFNELPNWNTGSPRYRDVEGIRQRERDWLAMAMDGYELAYITLQILQPTGGYTYAPEKPLKRLAELARGGDVGAMCLYPRLARMMTNEIGVDQKAQWPAYERQGMELGHPGCLSKVSYFLMTGIHGYPKDVLAGFDAAVRASRAGYDGSRGIAVYLSAQPMLSERDWERYYCWQMQAGKFSGRAGKSRVVLRMEIEKVDNPQLEEKLAVWNPTLDECVAFGIEGRK